LILDQEYRNLLVQPHHHLIFHQDLLVQNQN